MRIDQVIIREFLGDQQVGLYSAAVKISEFFYVLPSLAVLSILPVLSKMYREEHEKYLYTLKMIMGFFFWMFLILGITIQHAGPYIILLLFGSKFENATPALVIHMYSGIIVSLGIIYSHKFVLDKKSVISLWGSICGAVSNVILNLYFIPRWGIQGAAIATLISNLIIPVFTALFLDRSLGRIYLESIIFFPKMLLKKI
jgi:O-antigen/teichoic acid export membrane protein